MTESNGNHESNRTTFNVPQHVAIIMDGNGRWAGSKGLPRVEGHRQGAKTVRAIVEESRRLGVRYLTLYCFSTENWKRPEQEVSTLMKLFKHYLDHELDLLLKNGVRLRAIGELKRLPEFVQSALRASEEKTKTLDGMQLVLAVSYGGREEIVQAVRGIVRDFSQGRLTAGLPSELEELISEEFVSARLYAPDIPDPELLIRTSDECRISNFLLWQLAYSEIVVSAALWPDFSVDEYHRCLAEFSKRQRRFGMTAEQILRENI